MHSTALLLSAAAIAAAAAAATKWTVVPNWNAVPTGKETAEKDLAACEAKAEGHTVFAFNLHSKHCYVSDAASFGGGASDHVTSGCNTALIAHCATPPPPPTPPTPPPAPPLNVTHDWVFKTSTTTGYVHMATIEQVPGGMLAVAFQATHGTTEGADDQSIFLKLSHDGGSTWGGHTVLVKSGFAQAVWGPVLQWDSAAQRMLCFFSASVPGNERGAGRSYPGGDIYLIRSPVGQLAEAAANWTAPQKLLSFDDARRPGGPVAKVTANKPAISVDGRSWALPFWQEGHTVKETGSQCAGVLVSADGGGSWAPSAACLSSGKAGWLIENTVAFTADGDLLMLFRTKAGRIWQSRSADVGATWSTPNATDRLNPNSKTFLTAAGDAGRTLVLTYNPSTSHRTPLSLATSHDAGRTWADVAVLDAGGVDNFAYPTTVLLNGSAFSVYSADVHTGIRLAITKGVIAG